MFLPNETKVSPAWKLKFHRMKQQWNLQDCLLYTSDAADDQ